MANVSIGILGLGRIGASIALALKRYNASKDAHHTFEITLSDTRAGVREEVQKMSLAPKIERNVFDAAENKDIVLLALPYAEVKTVYEVIGPLLRAGSVVMDTSPLKQPSLEWASKYLRPESHMIGITPILNPYYLFEGLDDTQYAREDLFDKGTMLLMPGVSADKDAVELASDFSTLLGSTPHFLDPAEHDGLIAMTEGLPALLGIAAFYLLQHNRGWGDIQRLTNPAFGLLTHHLYDTHPDDLRDTWLNNRDNLLRVLDELTGVLRSFREILAEGNQAALESALVSTSEEYSQWINRRHNARWDEGAGSQTPSVGQFMLGSMMGSLLGKRLSRDKNGDKDE
jgi:prephenate dehydrogenase